MNHVLDPRFVSMDDPIQRAVQVMYSRDAVKQDPILAAVGQLQFEVVQARMVGMKERHVIITSSPLIGSVRVDV